MNKAFSWLWSYATNDSGKKKKCLSLKRRDGAEVKKQHKELLSSFGRSK